MYVGRVLISWSKFGVINCSVRVPEPGKALWWFESHLRLSQFGGSIACVSTSTGTGSWGASLASVYISLSRVDGFAHVCLDNSWHEHREKSTGLPSALLGQNITLLNHFLFRLLDSSMNYSPTSVCLCTIHTSVSDTFSLWIYVTWRKASKRCSTQRVPPISNRPGVPLSH